MPVLIIRNIFWHNLLQLFLLDANVQSDVKINLNGVDKEKTEAACRRSGLCGPEAPKPQQPILPQLAVPAVNPSSSDNQVTSSASAIQALQQLVSQDKTQNGVAKDTATVMINGIPVKIPIGK